MKVKHICFKIIQYNRNIIKFESCLRRFYAIEDMENSTTTMKIRRLH